MPAHSTITRDHAQLRAAMLDVESYRLHFDLTDPTIFQVHTLVTFTVSDQALGHTTSIDLVGHEVAEARLNGRTVTYDGSVLWLENLQERNELLVSSSAPYSTTGEGLHRYVDPFDEAEYLYSQCEPADARRMFPVFDQPDLKAVFEVHVTAPAHWEVLSNQPGVREIDGDVAHWTFEPTPTISSYLVALIAGEYTRVGQDSWDTDDASVPLGLWARKSMAKYVDTDDIFAVTKAGFKFFEAQFGQPYPFAKYDQIFVPEFNAGAMENVGAVTITEEYIFRSPVPQAVVQHRAITILHELAHMWFGNLVTMRWWDDLWLNESFAEFVSHLAAVEAGFPHAWTTFNATEKSWAYRQDQLPTTHPVIADMVDLDAVAVNFDGITYAKGASVLSQLVAWVGQEQFMAGVRNYFAAHAWSNTEFSDLLRHLEAASGRDLSDWSQQWLHATGVNTLSWQRNSGLTITQSSPQRQHRVAVGGYAFDGERLTRVHSLEVDLHAEVTMLQVPDADLFLVNDGDLTYAKLRPDAASLQVMTEHLGVLDDPLARSLCWGAAWDLTRDAEKSSSWFLQLIRAHILSETESSVVFSLLRQVSVALTSFVPDAQRTSVRADFTAGLWELVLAAGSGSDVQLQLIQAFIQHAGPEQLETVAALADRRGPEGFVVSTDMAWAALQRLVALGKADESEIEAALVEDDSSTGHLAALQAHAMLPAQGAKTDAWRHITGGELTNLELRHMVMGFSDVQDPALLANFSGQYFASIESLWASRSFETAETLALGLFPDWRFTVETAEQTLELADATVHTGLRRILLEKHDEVLRALAAQAVFSS